jgi:primosomal protein N' (replication factor Y)
VLPHRIGGRPLPSVELVDLVKERAGLPRGRKLILTRALARALADVLAEGGQALLFLNRRGFSTQITCFACGRVERCPDCDIALVFHSDAGRLRCHYCDHQAAPPERCAGCGSEDHALLGIGTERVEEEVRARFPDARIARLDRDVAARRGATEGVLRALRDRRVDVVVGTQMLAKGHDFPGVRLVGVVNADLGLHLPDFRAAERTFQLLTQVAGRAGRGREPGRVIVQTWVPEHYAIRPVAEHDYETFYAEELAQRAALGYPPCGSLARALVSAPELEDASAAAASLAEAGRAAAERLAAEGAPSLELLGPAPAPLARLRGRHRIQLLAKGPERAGVRAVAAALLQAAAALPRSVRAQVDADPYSML